MDCVVVSSRIAAYIDGELAPAEEEQFTLHIERCDLCAQLLIRLEAQRFMPLTGQEKATICDSASFWSKMDSDLCSQLDEMAVERVVVSVPWYSRKVGMPAPMVVAYAAAMLLAVAWGMQQQERAQMAEGSVEHLGNQLEQERRLANQPAPSQKSSGNGRYKVVNYTPQSGTF